MEVCKVCRNTGMRPLSEYLDCTDCNSAVERAAFNKWRENELNSIGTENDDWAIHQRALAMAPKQEAPRQWVAIKDSAWVNIVNHDHAYDGWNKDDIINHVFKLTEAKCKELNGPGAAPEAANGAPELPPLPEMASAADLAYVMQTPEDWDADYRSTWQKLQVESHNKRQWRKYALELRAILAAAGPDAALVKALDDLLEMYVRMANSGDCGFWNPEEEPEVIASRAALSGAKGN